MIYGNAAAWGYIMILPLLLEQFNSTPTRAWSSKDAAAHLKIIYRRAVDLKQDDQLPNGLCDKSIALYIRFSFLCVARDTREDKARFIGYVEGLTHTSTPDWWSNSLYSKGKTGGFQRQSGIKYTKCLDNLLVPSQSKITGVNGSLNYSSGKITYSIPPSLLSFIKERTMASPMFVDITDDIDNLYIAFYSDSGFEYSLASIEKKRMKLNWIIPVWAAGRFNSTGISHHYVAILPSEHGITIYGVATSSLYVEQFDKQSGLPIIRFSSSLWGTKDK